MPRYQFELGQAHLTNKQSAEALADFQKTVELDPGNVPARVVSPSFTVRRIEMMTWSHNSMPSIT